MQFLKGNYSKQVNLLFLFNYIFIFLLSLLTNYAGSYIIFVLLIYFPIVYPLCMLWIFVFIAVERQLEKLSLKRGLAIALVSVGIIAIVCGLFFCVYYGIYSRDWQAEGISFNNYLLQQRNFRECIMYIPTLIFSCIFASFIRWSN